MPRPLRAPPTTPQTKPTLAKPTQTKPPLARPTPTRPAKAVTAALGAGLALLAALTLGPLLFPRPNVPEVLRANLPPPTVTEATGNPAPEYSTTASIRPLISGRVNLNTATTEQLEALPQVGEKMAQRIVEARPLRSLADLDAVSGVGEKTLEQLAPLVTF